MKILHVITDVHRSGGGTSEVVPRLCRALQELGHCVTLACVKTDEISDTANDAVAAGVKLVQCKRDSLLRPLALSSALSRGLKDLVANADIVHLHGLWQAPCWYAAAECLRQHKPYVMMPHGFLEPERLKISKWKKRIIGSLFDRRYLMQANALVATAASEAEGFRLYGLSNPVHIMPIGLDLERYESKSKVAIERSEIAERSVGLREERNNSTLRLGLQTSTKKKLLFFSRVTPVKGLDMLVEAWKRLVQFHNDWELVITGPDDRGYTRELQSYITSLGLTYIDESKSKNGNVNPSILELGLQPSTITFTGPVYGDAKYQALRSADAFVLPTRSENWSIAVAEAMASGLPVVCTKGAPWSCIDDFGAGCWVDISVDAIAEGLEKVMSANDAARRQMGGNGRRWVEDNLSWPGIAKDMMSFYEKTR